MHAKAHFVDAPRREAMRIAGDKVHRDRVIEIRYPWTGEVVATVPKAGVDDVRRAFRIAREYRPKLTRHERYKILMRAGEIIASRKDEIARQITLESGLCLKDSLYEVGRASDVLLFAANQAFCIVSLPGISSFLGLAGHRMRDTHAGHRAASAC